MKDRRKQLVVVIGVAVVWLATARVLARYGAFWLPRSVASQLTLHAFLAGVLVIATTVGLALSFALMASPREELGLVRCRPVSLAGGTLWAPITAVLSAYAGFKIALPTLIEEIRRGGRAAAQANTGEFGRALVESHVLTTIAWGVILTPIAEELIFRGALWSAIRRITAPPDTAPSLPPELLRRSGSGLRKTWAWLRDGGIATVISAGLFAWMHHDQAGGAGIVRVVQAACLGVVLGVARHTSRSLWPGILLHACFNLITLSKVRRWLVSEGWPPPLPIPIVQWYIAACCAALLALWWFHRISKLKDATARAAIYVQCPREQVFDVVICPETIPAVFHGHGPIPRATQAEMLSAGGMRKGATRRVTNADGSVIDEEITTVERPSRHAYRLTKGLKLPFTLLVRSAKGEWQLEQQGDGTQITWTFSFELTSAFAWPVGKLMTRPFGIAMQQALARIRDMCEQADHDA